jgi:hypothetical protein
LNHTGVFVVVLGILCAPVLGAEDAINVEIARAAR